MTQNFVTRSQMDGFTILDAEPMNRNGRSFTGVTWLCAKWVVIPAVLVTGSALACAWGQLDLVAERALYDSQNGHFLYDNYWLWSVLYEFGPLPGILLFASGVVAIPIGLLCRRWREYFRVGLFLVLTFLLGPGLLVNEVCKNHLGRARPRETVQFGGTFEYTGQWQFGPTGRNSSFPSGHASVGFYVATASFCAYSFGKKRIACGLAIGGVGLGVLIGIARMAQGAHFLSDIGWSSAIVYFSAVFVADCTCLNPLGPSGRSLITSRIGIDFLAKILAGRLHHGSVPQTSQTPSRSRVATPFLPERVPQSRALVLEQSTKR